MLGFSKIPFKRNFRRHGYAESISATSGELMAHLNAESSESLYILSDDEYEYEHKSDDSFLCTTASNSSFGEFLEISTTRNTFEEALQVIPEVDGEARLIRIVSWVAKGYRVRELDFDNSVRWLNDRNVSSGLDGDRGPGRAKLEQRMKLKGDMKRKRERRFEKKSRVGAGLKKKKIKPWKVIETLRNRCFDEPVTPPPPGSPAEGQRGVKRSCVSEETKVKKGTNSFAFVDD